MGVYLGRAFRSELLDDSFYSPATLLRVFGVFLTELSMKNQNQLTKMSLYSRSQRILALAQRESTSHENIPSS